MALISIQNLTIGYDSHKIIENINCSINEKDYLCIIGENGSGKSTLMKTILGLNKIISGNIVYGDGLQNTEIGYLPQQTFVQKDFPASVEEIVISGLQHNLHFRPFYNLEEKNIAVQNMKKLGILHLSKCSFRELSGGQQQRVLLARALSATKKILLLDEPVSGLDPKATQNMYDIIQKLNNDGISIIMISHDINSILEYATHILYVGHNTTFFGTKEEYLQKYCNVKSEVLYAK